MTHDAAETPSPQDRQDTAVKAVTSSWRMGRVALVGAVFAIAVGVGAGFIAYSVSNANESRAAAQAQTAGTAQQAQSFAEIVKAACAKDIVAAIAQGFPCVQASSIAASPVPGQTGQAGADGPRGPGPTQAEITLAVVDYLTAHPAPAGAAGAAGQNASIEQVTGAVATYLTAHPAVTTDDLMAAVSAYLRANPPPPGINGKDGKDGTAGTSGTNGKDGANGAQGVGVANIQITRCELIFTLTDGKTIDAGAVCSQGGSPPPSSAPPPTTTTAPPLVPLPTR